MERALVIQLARLGDLVQSLPALAAIKHRHPDVALDVLCAAPLTAVVGCCPMVDEVIPWDGVQWRAWAQRARLQSPATWHEAHDYVAAIVKRGYARAYNLNQHTRAVLAAHLFATEIVGPGNAGPLASALPAWAEYLRHVASDRGSNRVHLADAFCGLSGVLPTGSAPSLSVPPTPLSADLESVGKGRAHWIAVIVGAGEPERCVPPSVWSHWITEYLRSEPAGRIVLIGGRGEREAARAIEEMLAPSLLGRVWNAVGRTDLKQLMTLLHRCDAVIGSDTGPLHLGAALGKRVMGLYVARARVHETGPYGMGHWVWQSDRAVPDRWPISESIELLRTGSSSMRDSPIGWQCWQSRLDRWGAYYVELGSAEPERTREATWRRLLPAVLQTSLHERV